MKRLQRFDNGVVSQIESESLITKSNHYQEPITLAPAGIFFGGGVEARSTNGGLVRRVAAWGVQGGGAPRTPRKFSNKLLKNQ